MIELIEMDAVETANWVAQETMERLPDAFFAYFQVEETAPCKA